MRENISVLAKTAARASGDFPANKKCHLKESAVKFPGGSVLVFLRR